MPQEQFIDLHMHSTFSDGVLSPKELVEMAGRKKLVAISLADHDSLDGYSELYPAAEAAGIEVFPGVELSCEHAGNDVHVLAYGVDLEDDAFLSLLSRFRSARLERGIQIVEKLSDCGIDIRIEDVLAKAKGGALGRPHIAEVLMEQGHVSEFGEAFAKYIGEDCPAYVEKYKLEPADAVVHIHHAGGLAFVAHPGYYLEKQDTFDVLIDSGFDGIEVYHPHHNASVVERLAAVAKEKDLLMSGGSDFHGFAGRDNMGEPSVPYEVLARIKERLA